MLMDRDELMLLSRGGRVPRALRDGPRASRRGPPRDEREGARPGRPLSRRVAMLRGRSRPSSRRGELNAPAYLDLEFVVDDER